MRNKKQHLDGEGPEGIYRREADENFFQTRGP